jgi:hypothetical protein
MAKARRVAKSSRPPLIGTGFAQSGEFVISLSCQEEICMNRLILVLAAWISLVSVASASLTPRKERSPLSEDVRPVLSARTLLAALEQPVARETESEFVVTEQTEILLNGEPCKYADVPSHASIIKMEVAADKKTVRKIHFRTRK